VIAVTVRADLVALLLLPVLAGCSGRGPSASIGQADTIFVNGNVITMDDRVPSAQAIAVAAEKIVAVGSNSDVERWRGPATTVVDLKGHTVVPGFIDAHQYRVQKYADAGYPDAAAAVNDAVLRQRPKVRNAGDCGKRKRTVAGARRAHVHGSDSTNIITTYPPERQ
jgi:hypothetical protein